MQRLRFFFEAVNGTMLCAVHGSNDMNVLKIRHRYALGLAVALATSVLVVMGSIAHAISQAPAYV